MLHSRDRLTDKQIEKTKPKTKPYTLADGAGLGLIVTPNHAMYWRIRLRHNGAPKMLSAVAIKSAAA